MPADHSILKSNLAFSSQSFVAEFATIIAMLHDNQVSKPGWNQKLIRFFLPPLPSPPFSPFVPLSARIMATPLKDLIFYFYGRDGNDGGRQEEPMEFIENLNFAINGQVYADENRKLIATQIIFRIHLRDKRLL